MKDDRIDIVTVVPLTETSTLILLSLKSSFPCGKSTKHGYGNGNVPSAL